MRDVSVCAQYLEGVKFLDAKKAELGPCRDPGCGVCARASTARVELLAWIRSLP